ncbi:MAG: beta strand repeat-containing protein, partial [Acidovorax defluvii]
TLIIDGITVTATGGAASAIDIATAFRTGGTSGNAVVSGTDSAAWGGAAGSSLNQLVFTSATADSNVTDIAITGTAATPTVVTTQGSAAVTGTTESANVTFTALKSGQSVLVAGRTVTANAADLTEAQVEAAFLGGVNAGNAVVGGTLANWTVAEDATVGNGILTFTSTTPTTNVANIDVAGYGVTAAPAATAAALSIADGTTTAGGGALTLTNMANAGTVELTGANNGTITVTMKDATGSADSLNLKLNGTANLAAGAVAVAGVETINIATTDSLADTPAVQNPTVASTLQLNAAAATTITVTGNHGVDFTGSNLAKVTTLDASGVAGNVNTTGMTAAQIIAANGVAGAVTFTAQVTDKAVTITTGNGNDLINASLVGTATGSTVGATITTGAGVDTVTGSKNADVINTGSERDTVNSSGGGDTITLGAGNDVYVLGNGAHSVLAKYDTITDFSANTYGQGTAGAVDADGANTTVANLTGDTINVSGLFSGGVNGIKVFVATNAADAQTFIQNTANVTTDTAANYTGFALDSSSNQLYMDFNQDGAIDSVVKLTGVTTITEAAFVTGFNNL